MGPEDRAMVGRWLNHASAQARTVERHLAAERAAAALTSPELRERVRQAVLHPDRES
ncbi:MAG TPA: hypothetical protein VIP77_16080 [Jiangellaceae bacterium]